MFGTAFAVISVMAAMRSKLNEVNLLSSNAGWAWPVALRGLFEPRGVNLLMASRPAEFVNIIEHRRIHAMIIDMDSEKVSGLSTIKIIRMEYPLLPCILLSSQVSGDLLGKALKLDVFGVIDKPVDMDVLLELLNQLFVKKYNSDVFSVKANKC